MAASSPIHPLNPADYFTLVMDHEIRTSGLPGGLGAVAAELAGVPDRAALSARIAELNRAFPLATSRLRRNGKRYGWVQTGDTGAVLEWHPCPEGHDEASFREETLRAIMNRPEPWDTVAPLSFHLLAGHTESMLVMRWLHPLLDARGAELVFDFLRTDDPARRRAFGQPETGSLVEAHLRRWPLWRKIGYFFKAKRHIESIDRLDSALPAARSAAPLRWNFARQRFDADQSAAIAKNARRCVGLGGKTLYHIGCLMRAIEATGPETPGAGYCAPYAFNLRKQKALTPIFGNHVGVLFAQAPRGVLADRGALFRHLRQQNADVIRHQLDYAFLPLMWLGSWLSPARYGKVLRRQRSGGERSSFWFSDIGEIRLGNAAFCGTRITGLFHLCQVTAPPSLAVLVGEADGRLTLTYNFLEPALGMAWIDRLKAHAERELLHE